MVHHFLAVTKHSQEICLNCSIFLEIDGGLLNRHEKIRSDFFQSDRVIRELVRRDFELPDFTPDWCCRRDLQHQHGQSGRPGVCSSKALILPLSDEATDAIWSPHLLRNCFVIQK